uniref:Sodium/hydrogen exchanger 9B1 n=1 Tax=Schistocephalus solidus TaxID=70667 RepID=A0A0X3P1B4_SCHSO
MSSPVVNATPKTTPNMANQLEEDDDPSCLLTDAKAENPKEVATDQTLLTSSMKHSGIGRCLPTLPEDLPLNMSNKETKASAGTGGPSPSWRPNAHIKTSPAGGEHVVNDPERGNMDGSGCCACCRCSPCCRKGRCLPPGLVRVLLWIYEKTAGLLAYGLFFLLIYACLWIFTGKEALPPKCVEYKRTDTATDQQKAKPVAVCEGGRALNILIFYAFAVLVGQLTELIRLPGLVGMLLSGLTLHCITVFTTKYEIISAPDPKDAYELVGSTDAISDRLLTFVSILNVDKDISSKLRQIALATILTRAGLGLDPAVLKQVCGGVARVAFIPCLTEAMAAMVISKYLMNWPWVWAAMLGFVLAAVSPAVVVPSMMRLEVAGWGVNHGIPTLIMAASSMDDVVAITGFGVALSIAFSKGSLSETMITGPIEVAVGAAVGLCMGITLWFIPPAGMEHCNVLRGSCLFFAAVAAIVGTVKMNLPGAGALACLVFSFVVSLGWQHGMPWRLMRNRDKMLPDVPEQSEISSLSANNHHVLGLENEHHDYYRQHLRRLRRKAEKADKGNALAAVYKGRRFSLPEPKPAYETEEFCSRHQNMDSLEIGFGRSVLNRSLSGTRRRQRNNSSPVMRWRTISETPTATVIATTSLPDEPQDNNNRTTNDSGGTISPQQGAVVPSKGGPDGSRGGSKASSAASAAVTATAEPGAKPSASERGLACVKTMRSFMATLWWFVQPLLFCLIGADVAVEKVRIDVVGRGIAAIACALVCRLFATFLAVTPSHLTYRERIFVAIAWMPKATVQAAIGPLALDAARKVGEAKLIDWGEQILTLAALSILITAPLGAILMMLTAPCLLTQDRNLLEVDHALEPDQAKRGDVKPSKVNSLANRPPWRI